MTYTCICTRNAICLAAMAAASQIDGRGLRSQRSREAVTDAVLDLLQEGILRPTAARIAERAGVSLRTVFQHFEDMEQLRATAGYRETLRLGKILHLHRLSSEGPIEARIEAFVDQRSKLLEAVAPVRRAAL